MYLPMDSRSEVQSIIIVWKAVLKGLDAPSDPGLLFCLLMHLVQDGDKRRWKKTNWL